MSAYKWFKLWVFAEEHELARCEFFLETRTEGVRIRRVCRDETTYARRTLHVTGEWAGRGGANLVEKILERWPDVEVHHQWGVSDCDLSESGLIIWTGGETWWYDWGTSLLCWEQNGSDWDCYFQLKTKIREGVRYEPPLVEYIGDCSLDPDPLKISEPNLEPEPDEGPDWQSEPYRQVELKLACYDDQANLLLRSVDTGNAAKATASNRPLCCQSISEICQSLKNARNVRWIFVADDATGSVAEEYHPGLLETLDLAMSAHLVDEQQPAEQCSSGGEAFTESRVHKIADELNRRNGTQFILVWQIEKSDRVEIAFSSKYDRGSAKRKISRLLCGEVAKSMKGE